MAKKLKFRLATVLRLRKQKEDERKRAVARRLNEINGLHERIKGWNRQMDLEIESLRAAAIGSSLDVPILSRRRHWLAHLRHRVLETEFQIRQLEQLLAEERQYLGDAAKEVKALEKLRDNAQRRFHEALKRQETAELDEVSIQRYRGRQLIGHGTS